MRARLTLSHVDCEGALADRTTSKRDIDGVLALQCGRVRAVVATVALVLNGTRHCVLLAGRVHDHHFHFAHTSS